MANQAVTVAVIGGGSGRGTIPERLTAAGATVVTADGTSEERVIATCADADVVQVFGLAPFTERVLAALPRLKYIQQCTVGYDRIDVEAATRHGVMVANSPLFCLEEVSDHAVMLIMACARKLSQQLHAERRVGWDRQAAVEQMGPIYRMRGKTVGFVAFGKIARLTAEKLSGFGMRYLAYDPFLKPEQVRQWKVELVSLDELCKQSDFISMHALLNADTRGMFGRAQFGAMKPTSYFVNTSRGATVDEAALIEALREGRIAGAGLDVVEVEPPSPDNPLLDMPNVLWTPHTAGYSVDAMADNSEQTTDEIVRVLNGDPPRALVNADVLANARLKLPVRA
jgi:D-3-phosphoglycerate dehydrogenase